jgi:hypothetical protein
LNYLSHDVISRFYLELFMEKVLQVLVVLGLLMLAVNYYIRAEKTRFRPYYAAGRSLAPADLLWNLPGVDPDNQLLFLVGDAGTTIEVLDSHTRELIAHISAGADPGARVFDPESRMLYSADGDGIVSIFRQVDKETYKILQTLVTRPGCRVLALDIRTKKIYLPVDGSVPGTDDAAPPQPVDCWVYSNH